MVCVIWSVWPTLLPAAVQPCVVARPRGWLLPPGPAVWQGRQEPNTREIQVSSMPKNGKEILAECKVLAQLNLKIG